MQTSSVQGLSYVPTSRAGSGSSVEQVAAGPGDRVTLGDGLPDHNCWDPRKWGKDVPGASGQEGVRAEVRGRLDRLSMSDCADIVHTTRGLPVETMHAPQAPAPFAAGRFHVTFRDRTNGNEDAFVFETEAGPGHLATVTPGSTEIGGGYISLLADPKDPWGKGQTLNRAETDCLIDRIYQRFQTKMEDEQADKLQTILSYACAIRYSGQGEATVAARHQEQTRGL